ncbi:MAG: hypothetical protein RIR21_2007 [Pseudomonadota bacterium]|jgi:hypothetical protein
MSIHIIKKEKAPSNRNFGLLFAGVFTFVSAFSFYRGANTNTVYGWLTVGLVLALIAISAPGLLTMVNKSWIKLGDLIGKVVSPLVLGIIFFFLITPIAVISRLFGRDELHIKKINVCSCWIDRVPHGPSADSFKNQF